MTRCHDFLSDVVLFDTNLDMFYFIFNLGVESAAIKGDDKNQLEVVGEIDAAALTSLLRKNLGQADLVSVGPAGGGGDKGPKAGSDKMHEVAAAMVQSQPALYYYAYPSYQYPVYKVNDPYDQPSCSIM